MKACDRLEGILKLLLLRVAKAALVLCDFSELAMFYGFWVDCFQFSIMYGWQYLIFLFP